MEEIKERMKDYLQKKYGEEIYNRNKSYIEMSTEEVAERYDNFLYDYYGAFTDADFLYDVMVWKDYERRLNNGKIR